MMVTRTSAEIIVDGKNLIGMLQTSMGGTEESIQASRDRAEILLKLLQELLDRAEELSQKSKETAEATIRMSQTVLNQLNEICQAAEEDANKAKEALQDAIEIARTRSDSIMNTAWQLSTAAKEAIKAPEEEAKSKWWNG